jgi:hypothetical protein
MVAVELFSLSVFATNRLQAVIGHSGLREPGDPVLRGESRPASAWFVSPKRNDQHQAPRTDSLMTDQDIESAISEIIAATDNPMTQAQLYALFAAKNRIHEHGNRRAGRAMMNGHLLAHGIDAITIPVPRHEEYLRKTDRFIRTGDATEMMRFFNSCYLETQSL